MPVFERQISIQAKNRDGKPIVLPPSQGLQAAGPVLSVVVSPTKQHLEGLALKGQPAPQPIVGFAIIDTGATATAVDEEVCKKLGLQPTGVVKTAHAGGSEVRACYPIQITFPNTPFPPITSPCAMSVNLQFGKTPLHSSLWTRPPIKNEVRLQRHSWPL